jgi:hypothetical protein
MHLHNLSNNYQQALGSWFDRMPKSVLAALAVSFAIHLEDHQPAPREFDATALHAVVKEWMALYDAGIVPQRPPLALLRQVGRS